MNQPLVEIVNNGKDQFNTEPEIKFATTVIYTRPSLPTSVKIQTGAQLLGNSLSHATQLTQKPHPNQQIA